MSCFSTVERQILKFIDSVVEREHIDLIVCSERKATAVLRALISEVKDGFRWEWRRTLSTAAMSQFEWSKFEGAKVLLFDELVHHGKTLERYEEALNGYVPDHVEVVTAGFVVWDRCEHRPDHSFYSSVDSETYEQIRENIVGMLQRHGSLLLDTEHIELSVRVKCGVGEFYNELARATDGSTAFSFVSGSGRSNLTLGRPEILSMDLVDRLLTPGSNPEGVVCKVRVIERSHEVFSIMPIFYPDVSSTFSPKWRDAFPDFCQHYSGDEPTKELFYVVGLLCSVELLRGVVAALTESIREGKVVLETPRRNFAHLHAMFPKIDTDELQKYVFDVVAESKRLKPRRSRGSASIQNVAEEKLLTLCNRVLCALVELHDDAIPAPNTPEGETWSELIEIAKMASQGIHLHPDALTVVVDRLIDAGLVVTDVEQLVTMDGRRHYQRTFKPEGEVVSSKIRQQMMVKNLRWA